MKTPSELIQEICANVLCEHRIKRDEESATALMQVAWEMGNGIEYETAIQSIIEEAIKADRAQRSAQITDSRTSPLFNEVLNALYERGNLSARSNLEQAGEDAIWANYLGPLLDELEANYGDD